MADGSIPRRDFLVSAGAGVAATMAAGSSAQGAKRTARVRRRAAGRSYPEERQRHHHRRPVVDRRSDRHCRRQDPRRRSGRCDGGAHRARNARARSQEADRHARPDRRPRPHGPRGAAQRLSGARQGALDQGHPGSHRRARPRQEARRVGRHHADRRSALLLRHARSARREALADAAGARRRPRRTIRSSSARSGATGAARFRSSPAPTPRRSSAPASPATPSRRCRRSPSRRTATATRPASSSSRRWRRSPR